MKIKYLFLLFFTLIVISNSWAARFPSAFHPVHVKPYFKKNGSFVQQHYRALPRHRNYSFK